MIKIEYDSKKYELSIEGHAEYAEKGNDIVCAAVSTLFFTLGESLTQYRNLLSDLQIEVDTDIPKIFCKPLKEYEGNIALIYITVLCGLQLLSENYPDNVQIIIL